MSIAKPNSKIVYLTIIFIDGTQQEFQFVPPQGTELSIGTRMEKFLHRTSIALALEDRLVIIPTHQIRSIEITPIASKLPDQVVANVQRVV